jgi:hypothetical protein
LWQKVQYLELFLGGCEPELGLPHPNGFLASDAFTGMLESSMEEEAVTVELLFSS